MTDEDELEEQLELTSIASERVTWESAKYLIQERAGAAFHAGDDKLANTLRELAQKCEAHRLDASLRQDVILNERRHRGK